jgi:hypothetical protein
LSLKSIQTHASFGINLLGWLFKQKFCSCVVSPNSSTKGPLTSTSNHVTSSLGILDKVMLNGKASALCYSVLHDRSNLLALLSNCWVVWNACRGYSLKQSFKLLCNCCFSSRNGSWFDQLDRIKSFESEFVFTRFSFLLDIT